MPTGADVTDKSIPKRLPHLPHGRWLGDLIGETPLNAAERQFLAACAKGELCFFNEGERPEQAGDDYTIRASLIRFLALGGDDANPAHERGVQLQGAWITGILDLQYAKTDAALRLKRCHFESALVLLGTRLSGLYLDGSAIPGLEADRMVVTSSVFLRNGFTASGEVRLLGAQIGQNLDCNGGTFRNTDKDGNLIGNALSADGIVVTGNIYLSKGFAASGEVRLVGAQIGRNLSCRGGTFLNKDKDGNAIDKALSADGMMVIGGLFLSEGKFIGAIGLAAAQVGTLIDDANCWPATGNIFDGLRYERIIGPTDAATRIDWLNRQHEDDLGAKFKPQPWEQLIKVLREMGHPADAAEIAMAKQVALRKAGKIGNPKQPLRQWLLYWPLHKLYGTLAGYGYRPLRLVGWMVMLWGIASLCFIHGANQGYMGPSTALLNSPEIAAQIDAKCGHHDEPGKQYWTRCEAMPAEYTTFQPALYALDLILPLVDLQQESDWGPIVESAPGVNMGYGVFLRWLMWVTILFGWMASLMLVAILGRLVDKD